MKSISAVFGAVALLIASPAFSASPDAVSRDEIKNIAQCQASHAMVRRVAAVTMTGIVIAQRGSADTAMAERFGRVANASNAKITELSALFERTVLPGAQRAGISEAAARSLWRQSVNTADEGLIDLFAQNTLDPQGSAVFMTTLANLSASCDRFVAGLTATH